MQIGSVVYLSGLTEIFVRFLLDTNIFIELEGDSILDASYAQLVKLLENNRDQVLIHPASQVDFMRDSNTTRRDRNLSRIAKYQLLEEPPDCKEIFVAEGINCSSSNDEVDCQMLCAVLRDAVHFLVTQDRGVHGRAKKLGISHRVFYISQALSSFGSAFSNLPIQLPNIEQIYTHQLKDDMQEGFFDSLRADYPGFDNWFLEKCCRAGRECWISKDSKGKVAAICIFAIQDSEPLTDDKKALPGKALKLCTFKVGEPIQGRKIGELFLKAAFNWASKSEAQNIFITTKKDLQPQLENLLTDFGFSLFGIKGDEYVLVKAHPKSPPPRQDMTPLEYNRTYWPHMLSGSGIRKFVIPIQPKYHQLLFPEWRFAGVQLTISLGAANAEELTPGNALKLAYLCHSPIFGIRPGDIVLFYRSKDFQNITTIGIVESAERMSAAADVLKRVVKRTVYSATQINEMAEKETLVILFRLCHHLPNPISYKALQENGIKGPIQSIRQIDEERFARLIEISGIENSFLAD